MYVRFPGVADLCRREAGWETVRHRGCGRARLRSRAQSRLRPPGREQRDSHFLTIDHVRLVSWRRCERPWVGCHHVALG